MASKSGILVDQHFGHTEEFYIFESDGRTVRFLEKRPSQRCDGADSCMDDKTDRMDSILTTVSDCAGVLAVRIGDAPAKILGSMGIRTVLSYDRIEDAVKKAVSE